MTQELEPYVPTIDDLWEQYYRYKDEEMKHLLAAEEAENNGDIPTAQRLWRTYEQTRQDRYRVLNTLKRMP